MLSHVRDAGSSRRAVFAMQLLPVERCFLTSFQPHVRSSDYQAREIISATRNRYLLIQHLARMADKVIHVAGFAILAGADPTATLPAAAAACMMLLPAAAVAAVACCILQPSNT